jgi:hypothetical protein
VKNRNVAVKDESNEPTGAVEAVTPVKIEEREVDESESKQSDEKGASRSRRARKPVKRFDDEFVESQSNQDNHKEETGEDSGDKQERRKRRKRTSENEEMKIQEMQVQIGSPRRVDRALKGQKRRKRSASDANVAVDSPLPSDMKQNQSDDPLEDADTKEQPNSHSSNNQPIDQDKEVRMDQL